MADQGNTTKSVVIKGEIKLEQRDGDDYLSSRELQQFDVFRRLKKPINVERYPGSMVFRKFAKGEIICRQGQPGFSAFYIPTAADMVRWQALKAGQELEETSDSPTAQPQAVLSAHVFPGVQTARKRGFLKSLFTKHRSHTTDQVAVIPNDGPTEIDGQTRTAELVEGDIFGEMSCMNFTPRSATIVAKRDCHLIEFNRNIFDQLQRDQNYREWMDQIYVERVLNTHLKGLEIFSDLDEQQLDILRKSVSLEVVDPGDVICEEGETRQDQPLDVFVIRSGVVQVVKNGDFVFHEDSIDWQLLCRQLIETPSSDRNAPSDPTQGTQLAKKTTGEKPSTAEILAQAAKPATSQSAGKGKPSTADILAAARKKASTTDQASQTSSQDTPKPPAQSPPKKLTTEEILAAAKKKRPADSPPASAPESKASPQDENETPATQDVQQAASEKKPSTADILAAARKKSKPPVGPKTDVPDPRKKPSTADILAAARGKSADASQAAGGDTSLPIRMGIAKSISDPRQAVFAWMSESTQAAVRRVANSEQPTAADRRTILQALQAMTGSRAFLMSPPFQPLLQHSELTQRIAPFPKGMKGIKKDWSELEVRICGRGLLSVIFPEAIRSASETSRAHRVLAYLSRGDCFGETALIRNEPRSASCIAYDHPVDESGRKPGRVELVRIKGSGFQELMDHSPTLAARVRRLVEDRSLMVTERVDEAGSQALMSSVEFQQMGLFQGTRLLLIDLDACTRCGDCVEACVDTHDDGQTRLYLDGPRFDRFLVPSACRSCLNPSCMIGCPVGSITRGDNGQIVIHEWCIGCQLCARQCPYDSIQMHDLGLIPEQSIGWTFQRLSKLKSTDKWRRKAVSGDEWAMGMSPFYWTADFREAVDVKAANQLETLCFQHVFDNDRLYPADSQFRLSLQTPVTQVTVWLNGKDLSLQQSPQQKRRGEWECQVTEKELKRGENLLSVQLDPSQSLIEPDLLLSVRLDVLPVAGERTYDVLEGNAHAEIELVTQRATVCDLCSDLPSQEPACVTSCPHEAAMRVNPLVNFPA